MPLYKIREGETEVDAEPVDLPDACDDISPGDEKSIFLYGISMDSIHGDGIFIFGRICG